MTSKIEYYTATHTSRRFNFMILSREISEAAVTGKVQTSEFDIGDSALIIEHLSKTIYSNPIKSCVQEYISNARDAHIEIGKSNIPVKVKLPNSLDPTIKFQDNGPGISPDRMHNVFIRYGKSTKRGNNNESGSFGCGAKTALSYSDTFQILTIALEDNKKVQRNYAVIKELGLAPKLVEFGEPIEMADDVSTGTTISFNVKPQDFDQFKTETINVCQFWSTLPEIEGCNPLPEWPKHEWAYEGSNWKIGFRNTHYYRTATGYVCIDGIPYPLATDNSTLYTMAKEAKVYNLLYSKVLMLFGVGELSVSLSRDALHYDDRTLKAIINRLKEIKDWIESNVQSQIEKASSYIEAKQLFSKLSETFDFTIITKSVFWNGLPIDNSDIGVVDGMARTYYIEDGKIRQRRRYTIPVKSKTLIVHADTGVFETCRVATLLDQYPDHKIYIYKPENEALWSQKLQGVYEQLNAIKLSTIAKKKLPKVVNTNLIRNPRYQISDCKIITSTTNNSYTDINYKADSGIYILVSRGQYSWPFTSSNKVSDTLGILGITDPVYCIPQKYAEKIKLNKSFKLFEDVIKEKLEQFIKTDANLKLYNTISEIDGEFYNLHNVGTSVVEFFNLIKKYIKDDHVLIKWMDTSKKLDKMDSVLESKYELISQLLKHFNIPYVEKADSPESKDLIEYAEKGKKIIEKIQNIFNIYSFKDNKLNAAIYQSIGELVSTL